MKTPEEKRFDRIRDVLLSEAGGNGAGRVCSQRTLFGIKSHAEEVIERVAAEMDAEHVRQAKQCTLQAKDKDEQQEQ